MFSFKKKITEQEVAASFVLFSFRGARDYWPKVKKNIQKGFQKISFNDERKAQLDLALAIIAQEMQAVENLFPQEQAERINRWVLNIINTKEDGEYSYKTTFRYYVKFKKELGNISSGGDPLSVIPGLLLENWLGQDIRNYTLKIKDRQTDILDPLLLSVASGVLSCFLGYFKGIKEQYKIVQT